MSRAFVKEDTEGPDDLRCPACGAIGQSVGRATIAAHLPPGEPIDVSDLACFCPNPRCDAGYFDAMGQMIPAARLTASVFPKDPDAPICSCFQLTADAVEHDARAGITEGVRQLIARAQTPTARCTITAANGRCCVAELQRHFLKHARK